MNTQLSTAREHAVRIPCGGVWLDGDLTIPAGARGLVIFAHGSGSSRLSPRNRMVAEKFHGKRLATLLFDLLTQEEGELEKTTGTLRFEIPLLADRLVSAIRWAEGEKDTRKLGIGLFGASTGAAAALVAASRIPEVQAVVSRGGRTDLAEVAQSIVKAPTLLIVGQLDDAVMRWNEETLRLLPSIKHLQPVHGATHLFAEKGALEEVASLAAEWFGHYLSDDAIETTRHQ